MRQLIAASLAFALTACGQSRAPDPDKVSAGEAKALDEAAAMLDERRLPPEALPPEVQPVTAGAPARTEIAGDTAAPLRQ